MALKFQRKKNINVMRIGIKIAITVIALWVSGFMLNVIGDVLNGTYSPFYNGLSLIGYTVTDTTAWSTSTTACYQNATGPGATAVENCIIATSGTGILSVVGLLAVAFLVFEFVDISY